MELAGPRLAKKKVTLEILASISAQIGRFLLMQIFTSVVVGVATWAALSAIGLNEAALWGLLAGVFNSSRITAHPRQWRARRRRVSPVRHDRRHIGGGGSLPGDTSLEGWLLTPMLMGRVANMNRVVVFVCRFLGE